MAVVVRRIFHLLDLLFSAITLTVEVSNGFFEDFLEKSRCLFRHLVFRSPFDLKKPNKKIYCFEIVIFSFNDKLSCYVFFWTDIKKRNSINTFCQTLVLCTKSKAGKNLLVCPGSRKIYSTTIWWLSKHILLRKSFRKGAYLIILNELSIWSFLSWHLRHQLTWVFYNFS